MEQLFRECCDFIDSEYKRLGHTLGYRFFLCPRRLLNPQTKILYLGLNPGGKEDLPEHPHTSCENGTAFFTESWKNNVPGTENLQVQTQLLFESVFGNFSFYSYKKACGQKKTVRGSKNSRRLSNDTPAI